MISSELIFILIIPVALAIVVLAMVSLEYLLLLTLFFTPLSIQLNYLTANTPFDMSLPTEPVLAMLLFITLFKLIVRHEFSFKLLRHPVTGLIALYLIWTLITAFTSSIPLVSFKALAYRTWFIAGFYLVAGQLFAKEGFESKYVTAYSAGLAIVVIFFLIRVGGAGLMNQKFAHSACYPFYKDHTSFGASIAFLLPVLFVMLFRNNKSSGSRILLSGLIFLFISGLVFSYSRAAWVSLLVSLAITMVLWLRVPKKVLFLTATIVALVLVFSAGLIWQRMDSTTEDSSADLGQHLRSSSNISTDQSNLERINRWKCALKMFAARPVVGWGPGTYQFKYAPFQRYEDRTIISTDFGDAGNAHSEYLGALSESGLPGALLFVLLNIYVLMAGIRVWYREKRTADGYLALAVISGLMTYMIHGAMNSFLDTDKIASLWWGFIAMLVAMDISSGQPMESIPSASEITLSQPRG